jgi:hypothetical protein
MNTTVVVTQVEYTTEVQLSLLGASANPRDGF